VSATTQVELKVEECKPLPDTPYFWHRSCSLVQSTSAMMTVLEPLYSSPSLSQAGFIDLQCPHLELGNGGECVRFGLGWDGVVVEDGR
jgi:hypothetical protein